MRLSVTRTLMWGLGLGVMTFLWTDAIPAQYPYQPFLPPTPPPPAPLLYLRFTGPKETKITVYRGSISKSRGWT